MLQLMALIMVDEPFLICLGLPGCEKSLMMVSVLSNGAVISVILFAIVTNKLSHQLKSFSHNLTGLQYINCSDWTLPSRE